MGRAVLHLGCGNSPFPEEMYDAGYHVQTCVDVSPSVVASMESRNRARPQMRWLACDCTDLQGVLEDETFDVVVDKGTFDAIACHDQHALMVARFVKEAWRLTRPGGVYLCLSLHEPADVLKWLCQRPFDWKVSVTPLGCQKGHHTTAYACAKSSSGAERFAENWPAMLGRVEERPDSDIDEDEELLALVDGAESASRIRG